jgi:DNA-binding transcriptional ArsR family regulator
MPSAPPAANVFAAIADPTRRALLRRLADDGPRNVSELLSPFRISQPAVSKHLRILRETGLVRSRRQGRVRIYEIEASQLQQVYDWVAHFERFWDQKLDALGAYLDRQKQKKRTR